MRAFAARFGRRHDNETLPCLASGESVPLRWVERKKTTCQACWAEVRVHRKDANGPPVFVLARHSRPRKRGIA